MPTRKQRRRRAKSHRHEYEIVYLDDEGNEVEVEPEEAPVRRERERDRKRDDARKGAKGQQNARGRTLQPPTWHRSFRRSLIMAPFFFIFLYVLQRDVASAAIVSGFYAAVFVPFSYGIDKLTYRTQLKRLERR
jgi:hypothetical protein